MHSSNEMLKKQIKSSFNKIILQCNAPNTGILLVHAPALDLHYKLAFHPDSNVFTNPDQPYHLASIGKTITAVMVAILHEQGRLQFNDFVSKYLEPEIWQGLHMWRGKDYSDQITLRHLLKQTSGLADYYLDKTIEKQNLMGLMLSQPDRFWSPMETIQWVKEKLSAKNKPGKKVHYADTNYQLLGLIIECITL